jgi:adenine-specific DNA-methyltransferase
MPTTLTQQLTNLLSTNSKYVVDGNQLKNKIMEDGLKCDPQLIDLLLSNTDIKKHFFVEATGGVLVFNSLKFQQFIGAKDFLPDSFTSYKNKIGLTDGDNFISTNKSVVLDFPYKDCYLEGGQTKDDIKRKEIFWNQTLAPDEIDILLKPKLFTNYQRYTTDKVIDKGLDFEAGVEATTVSPKSNNQYFNRNEAGTITDNLIIKGNNLLALHTLKSEFKAKVKLIYIDPPYNTGSDSFGYNDRFNHSTWLVFMKNRLEVARELLRDDGVIFVQCDDNEQAYLKVLMDEIFGRENYLNCVAVKMSTSAGLKMSNIESKLLKIKESILIFTKKPGKFKLQNIDELYSNKAEYETERSDKYIENIEENFENWHFCSLHQAFQKYAKPSQEKFDFVNENCDRIFNHVINPSTKKAWDKLSEGDKIKLKDKVRSYGVAGSGYKYAFNDHVFIPYNPKILDGDMWIDNYSIGGTKSHEGGVEFNNGKKREVLLKRIINISTNPNDIVLDYHLGSGTTAAVAHKMGRQYIGIEQMNYIQDISCVRMQKVLDGEQGGISKSVGWKGGGSFVYLELRQLNQEFVERIQNAKTSKELQTILADMKVVGHLDYLVNFEAIKASVNNFEALALEDQQRFLLELLDKNNVYICKSDLENEDYVVNEEDKAMNREFYKLSK